jgi:hypothetical protein
VPGQGPAWFVRITNVSNVYIPGPVLIAFTSLPPGVGPAPVNGPGAVGDLFVAGSLTGLAPGQSATAMVSFTGPPALLSRGVVAEVLAELPPPPLHAGPTIAPGAHADSALPPSPFALDPVFAGPAAAP